MVATFGQHFSEKNQKMQIIDLFRTRMGRGHSVIISAVPHDHVKTCGSLRTILCMTAADLRGRSLRAYAVTPGALSRLAAGTHDLREYPSLPLLSQQPSWCGAYH